MKLSSSLLWLSGAALLALIGTYALLHRNDALDRIRVTGLGKADFTSDLVVWEGMFNRVSANLPEAYQALEKDRQTFAAYLKEKGLPDSIVVFEAVDLSKEYDYKYNPNGPGENVFKGYRLSQRYSVQSKQVELVEQVAREVSELIQRGVELNSYAPAYYYTQLGALKVEMIAQATEDARMRASQIAEKSGAHLGNLRDARMGVFQIIARNSSEDFSWGGTFNTSSKEKTATVTVKLEFGID